MHRMRAHQPRNAAPFQYSGGCPPSSRGSRASVVSQGDGFLQNPLPDVGLEGVLEREVDALAQQLGQLVLEPREIEEGRRFAELDQHIDVAAASLLAARVRAEQP
jgi:hypothetical protein